MIANNHHARERRLTAGRNAARVLVPCAALLVITAGASAQAIPPDEDDVSLHVDSGLVQNSTRQRAVIFSTVVAAPGAPWLRLDLDQAHLGPVPLGGEETILRITSLHDGAQQNMNAAHLAQWEYTSAYFNGDALLLQIIADPSAEPSRLVCTHAWAGPPDPAEPETICGPYDDRILSYDNRSCRTRPTTCTAWIFDDANHMVLTAGHCAAGTINVIQFNVPLSDPNGSVNHPGPEDQYAADQSSFQFESAGGGHDWGYFGVFRNTETGLMPYEAYGDYHTTS